MRRTLQIYTASIATVSTAGPSSRDVLLSSEGPGSPPPVACFDLNPGVVDKHTGVSLWKAGWWPQNLDGSNNSAAGHNPGPDFMSPLCLRNVGLVPGSGR